MAALLGALIVFAHAGHWAVDALYLVPVIVLVVFALNGRRRERRAARENADNQHD
jgi:cytochrome c oxidase assembly factor CtaG